MADHRLPNSDQFAPLANWSVVLVEPLTSENVGAVARLCSNFAVGSLKIVNPRCDISFDGSAGLLARETGRPFLDDATIVDSLADGLSGVQYSIAMTMQDMEDRPVDWLGVAGPERVATLTDEQCALILGREDNGLSNDECAMASCRWSVPLNPENSSLNMSQAAAIGLAGIQGQLLRKSSAADNAVETHSNDRQFDRVADFDAINGLIRHLEDVIDACHFERGVPKEYPLRLMRRLAGRAEIRESEIKVLRGICRRVLNEINKSNETE